MSNTDEELQKIQFLAESFIGRRFGKLIVVSFCGTNKNKNTVWLCECDCGKFKKIITSSLTRKNKATRSHRLHSEIHLKK